MKKFLVILCAAVLVFGTAGISNADLIGGTGAYSDYVYDTFSTLTWHLSADMVPGPTHLHAMEAVLATYSTDGWRLPTPVELGTFADDYTNVALGAAFTGFQEGLYYTDSVFMFPGNPPIIEDYTIDVYNFSADPGALETAFQHYEELIPGSGVNEFLFGDVAYAWFIVDGDPAGLGGPVAVIPEPATMLLLGVGMIGMAGIRRKRKK